LRASLLIFFHLDDALCNLLENLIDAIASFCGCLFIYNIFVNIQADLHFLFSLGRDLPLVAVYIALVAGQRDHEVAHIVFLLHLVGPEAYRFETALVRHVVANQRGHCIAVIHANQTTKTI